jgi:preprotein translocase subunit SecG
MRSLAAVFPSLSFPFLSQNKKRRITRCVVFDRFLHKKAVTDLFINRSFSVGDEEEMMKAHWQKFILKVTMWLMVEILLNILGLDNLADYGEFVFHREVTILKG